MVPDGGGHTAQPFGHRDRTTRSWQLIDDADVKQHSLGVADRCQIMFVTPAGPFLPVVAGGGELCQVGQSEILQAPTGLDEQPRRHLRTGAEPNPLKPRPAAAAMNRSRSGASGEPLTSRQTGESLSTWALPSRACITARSTPASASAVPKVCRNACGCPPT